MRDILLKLVRASFRFVALVVSAVCLVGGVVVTMDALAGLGSPRDLVGLPVGVLFAAAGAAGLLGLARRWRLPLYAAAVLLVAAFAAMAGAIAWNAGLLPAPDPAAARVAQWRRTWSEMLPPALFLALLLALAARTYRREPGRALPTRESAREQAVRWRARLDRLAEE